jgi:VIT1/CCC1 family predicted Fe2+/Mn2+ transporter
MSPSRAQPRRGSGGNALRAAVLGANDGLCSNLSLVMGVAGAAASSRFILLTGMAGLIAGACSMAMGEWLSVTSSREFARRQIDAEAQALKENPGSEMEDLVGIYRAKGLRQAAARTAAQALFRSRDAALDTMAREELGIDPHDLGGSAAAAATSSFCLFAMGAIFPVAPFMVSQGVLAVAASVLLSGLALAAIGAATTLFTGRDMAYSAGRTLVVGYAAAGVTFAIGRILGASVA